MTSDGRPGGSNGAGEPARQRRVSRRTEAVTRISAALDELGLKDGRGVAVVVEAPETPYYVQFTPTGTGVNGEAVGLANLPRVHVYHGGDRIVEALADLGWAAPRDGDHGNWTRRWDQTSWDPKTVARLVVDTFRAYGLLPAVLVASTATFESI